ncbi:MAG: LPS-assembly protein LptD [Acidobacteria bacterium]|nr:LPS-assembly protein LptD [Acidobacteriota bacterium]
MGRSRILLCCVLAACASPAFAQAPAPAVPGAVPGAVAGALNDPFFGACTRSTQWQFERISATHLRLTGQVQVECPQMGFFADVIDMYTDPELRLVASGNVVFTNPEGRIAAESVEFNVARGTGTFHMASGIMSLGTKGNPAEFANQDPEVYFYGQTIDKLDQRRYKLTRGGFTTCVQPTPRWEVTSNSVVLTLDEYAVARNTVLRVKGVPLMYLPVLYYPIKSDERATGFLLPTYGASTLRGQTVSNAFFWAMGDSQDATLFHDWFTNVGQGAGAEYRYVASQESYGTFRFYRLNQRQAEFRQSGRIARLPAQSSFQVNGTGNQMLGTSLRLHERIDYTTSIITQQLYQQSLYQASNATRTIEGGLAGLWGPLTASALFQRTETFTAADTSQLYGSTPRLAAAIAPTRLFGAPIYASVNNDFSYLPFRQITNGRVTGDRSLARFDMAPSVRAALSRLTFLTMNTSASYRTTYYSRSADRSGRVTTDPLTRRYLLVRTDVVGPVLSKIWDTPDSAYSERKKHLVEPTFAVEYVPAIDNASRVLTLIDTTDVILGDTMRVTYGVNNRLLYRARALDGSAGSTIQFLTVGVQQTYYATRRSSLNDTQYVSTSFRNRAVDLSDVALTAKVSPSAALESTTRLEYDVNGDGLHLLTTGGTTQFAAGSTTVNYSRQRRNPRVKPESSLTWSTALKLLQGRATGAYSLTWDIGRAGILNQNIGFAYLAQCCGLQAEFQKFKFPQSRSDFPIPSDRRFNVSFVLAGIGTFSNFLGAFGGLMGS